MAREQRLLIAPDDIRGIAIECIKCRGRFVAKVGPTTSYRTPERCPQCGEEWLPFTGTEQDLVRSFVSALRALSRTDDQGAYRVLIELDG